MNILTIIQVIIAILMVVLILLQRSDAGLGGAFGGGDSGAIVNKKRGAEKTIFNLTIIVALLFGLISLLQIFL